MIVCSNDDTGLNSTYFKFGNFVILYWDKPVLSIIKETVLKHATNWQSGIQRL